MNIATTPRTPRSRRRRTRRAFTLIEIVVVVTIIALLAALIAPRLLSNIVGLQGLARCARDPNSKRVCFLRVRDRRCEGSNERPNRR